MYHRTHKIFFKLSTTITPLATVMTEAPYVTKTSASGEASSQCSKILEQSGNNVSTFSLFTSKDTNWHVFKIYDTSSVSNA